MGRRHRPRRVTKQYGEGDSCWFCMRGELKKKILTEKADRGWRDEIEDMYDLIEAEQRMAADTGARYSLDDLEI